MSTNTENDVALAEALSEEDSFRDERNWPPRSEEEVAENTAILSWYTGGNSEAPVGGSRSADSVNNLNNFAVPSAGDNSSHLAMQRQPSPARELGPCPICTEQMVWNDIDNPIIPCEHCKELFYFKCLGSWF
jgi:hypothetical protein